MSESEYTSLYEIVVMDDGKVALKQAGNEKQEPLVTISFSEQSKFYLGSSCSEVARKMIEAGLDAVSELEAYKPEGGEEGGELDLATVDADPVVH